MKSYGSCRTGAFRDMGLTVIVVVLLEKVFFALKLR